MPDVVVVGGGVVGAACADALARRGASVTLVERDGLAAGASGRNMGLWLPTEDRATQELARRSRRAYLELADDTPVPFRFDPAPRGYLLLAVEPEDVARGAEVADAIAAGGVVVEPLEGADLPTVDAAFAPDLAGAWRVHDGHRLDPAALTTAIASRARAAGARIRHHVAARALLTAGDRVTGVATDDGPIGADDVVVAAGPWTPPLLEPLGIDLPVTGALGWVVRVGPGPDLPATVTESIGWRHHDGDGGWPTARAVAEAGLGAFTSAPAFHPHDDGSLTVGAMRQAWVTPEPPDPSVVRRLLADAIRVAPAVADAPVRSSRWCVRPMSPDERPIVGQLADGLWACTGHGSEGVILGAGSAELLAALVLGGDPPVDPTPFAPSRFA